MINLQTYFKAFVLCLAALFCVALSAFQDQKPTVAVLEPDGDSSITRMNKMTARGALQECLVNSGSYRVVDRRRIDKAVEELGDARGDLFNKDTVKQLGKRLQADIICVSELLKEDGNFSAECSLIDVESGEVSRSATEFIESDDPADISKAMERIARKIIGEKKKEDTGGTSGVVDEDEIRKRTDKLKQTPIAVIIPEKPRYFSNPAGEAAVIKKMTEAGFKRMVDQNQLSKIRESDAVKAILRGDDDAAVGIATQLGSDYIIVGEAFSEPVGRVGGGLFSSRASMGARVIKADNATIIASNDCSLGGVDLTESTSAKKALNGVGEQIGDYMVKQLFNSVRESPATVVALTVKGVASSSKLTEMLNALRRLSGVSDARQNSWDQMSGVALIDITTKLSMKDLTDRITNMKTPRLEIEETSGSAMKIQMR